MSSRRKPMGRYQLRCKRCGKEFVRKGRTFYVATLGPWGKLCRHCVMTWAHHNRRVHSIRT